MHTLLISTTAPGLLNHPCSDLKRRKSCSRADGAPTRHSGAGRRKEGGAAMASVWKGSVSFGLVNIPVRLYPAVRQGKGKSISDSCTARISRRSNTSVSAPLMASRCRGPDIVNGYEYSKGKLIALTDDDLKAAAAESSTEIEMIDFVKQGEIDPRFFWMLNFLVPEKNGQRAYALFREALRSTETAGIGKFALRQKLHLVGIKAVGDALLTRDHAIRRRAP